MNIDEIKSRMSSGRLYFCDDEKLMSEQMQFLDRIVDYNQTRPSEQDKRAELLKCMFASIGSGCYVEAPLYANWGGKNVHFGNAVYANFGLTLVDDGDIFVGNNVMFAPHVTVCTATHPVCPPLRKAQAQYNLPVTICDNVWVGAGAVILPGVTIGENSVIGAGSVVTRDIPANVVAVGNPCRVMRKITERDDRYYNRDMPIDINVE